MHIAPPTSKKISKHSKDCFKHFLPVTILQQSDLFLLSSFYRLSLIWFSVQKSPETRRRLRLGAEWRAVRPHSPELGAVPPTVADIHIYNQFHKIYFKCIVLNLACADLPGAGVRHPVFADWAEDLLRCGRPGQAGHHHQQPGQHSHLHTGHNFR